MRAPKGRDESGAPIPEPIPADPERGETTEPANSIDDRLSVLAKLHAILRLLQQRREAPESR